MRNGGREKRRGKKQTEDQQNNNKKSKDNDTKSTTLAKLGRPWLWIGLAMAQFIATATAIISKTCSNSYSHSRQSQLSSFDCTPLVDLAEPPMFLCGVPIVTASVD